MIPSTPGPRKWLVPLVLTLALPALATVRGDKGSDPNRLFIVQRSVNANVVVYDAVRRDDGRLDTAHPVKAYWVMNADRGEHQALNIVEKAKAYGFSVANGARGDVTITLKAVKGRPIEVQAAGKRVVAVTRIAGREAVLRRVFVQTEKDHPLGVKYIELYGRTLRDRKPVSEQIKPG